jgi:uncharacterized protein YfaQ (DUF2300 family)
VTQKLVLTIRVVEAALSQQDPGFVSPLDVRLKVKDWGVYAQKTADEHARLVL